jgi:hypothetical protein
MGTLPIMFGNPNMAGFGFGLEPKLYITDHFTAGI